MEGSRLERWLDGFGFRANPFSSHEAGSEDRLNEYFVHPPGFDDILGDASSPETTLVFAPRGAGKTAQRLMVHYHCREGLTRGRVLSVPYTDFSQVIGHEEVQGDLSRVQAKHHVEEILKQTVRATADYLTDKLTALRALSDMPADQREYLHWFVDHYGDYLTLGQVDSLSADATSSVQATEHPSAIIRNPRPSQLLDQMCAVLASLGFEAVYVLVDRIDEFRETAADLAAALAFIEPLVADLVLMELPCLAFKFFLPLEMEDAIERLRVLRRDRLGWKSIKWEDAQLVELLHKRLEAFEGPSSLDAICVPELIGRLEPELVAAAKGSPRNLIRLGATLLVEQSKLPFPDRPDEPLITEFAWEHTQSSLDFDQAADPDAAEEIVAATPESPTDTHDKKLLDVADSFPAPIAMVCRDFLNQIVPQNKLRRLLDLVDATLIFCAFVLICEYATMFPSEGQGRIGNRAKTKLNTISTSKAVVVIENLGRRLDNHKSSRYGRRFARFYNRRRDLLDEFVALRNSNAHGALRSAQDSSQVVKKRIPDLSILFADLQFLANETKLIKVDNIKLSGTWYYHQARLCMGDNPNFAWTQVEWRNPLECDRLWLKDKATALLLHPLVIERRCEECGRLELFLYNKLTRWNATYVSYNCGHEFETVQYVAELRALL